MFFCRSFVVSSTERLPWGTLLWCVSEKFLSRKIYRISWEGGWGRRKYHDFLSNCLCLAVLKDFPGERFCAVFQKNTLREKICG